MTTKRLVTERALIGRINRRLAHDGEKLCKTRPHEPADWGDFHTIDCNRNAIIGTNHNLEEFARELNVMAAGEALSEEA